MGDSRPKSPPETNGWSNTKEIPYMEETLVTCNNIMKLIAKTAADKYIESAPDNFDIK